MDEAKQIKNIVFDLNGVLFEYHSIFPQKIMKPIEPGIKLLKKCHQIARSRKDRLFVCSNFNAEVFERLQLDFAEIFNLFDGCVNSSMAQAKKPDLKMFKYLCNFYKILPSESLFIDDQIINILAAQEFGMKAIHVVDFDLANKELETLYFN